MHSAIDIEIHNQQMPNICNRCARDQSWTDVLRIKHSSAKTLNVLAKKKIKDVIDISHLEDLPILPESRFSYPSPAPSDDFSIPEGRPKRITKVPAWYHEFALVSCDYAQEYDKRSEVVPETYSQAMASANAVQWNKAIDEEFNSLIINDTWKLVKQPERKRDILKSRWVFKIKRNSKGDIVR